MSDAPIPAEPVQYPAAINVWSWLGSNRRYLHDLEAEEFGSPANILRRLLTDVSPNPVIPPFFRNTRFSFKFDYLRQSQQVRMLLEYDGKPYPEGENAGAVINIRPQGNFIAISPTIWNNAREAGPDKHIEGIEPALWPYIESVADTLARINQQPVVCYYPDLSGEDWFDELVLDPQNGYRRVVGEKTFTKTFNPPK